MTKELTPLQALQNIKIKLIRTYDGSVGINGNMMFEKEIPIIEKALKDIDYLKALNEAGNNNIKLHISIFIQIINIRKPNIARYF